MIRSLDRLRSAEVAELAKSGRSLRAQFLSAKIVKGTNGTMRTAASVSKTVARGAVERNRLRRAVYRAIQSLTEEEKASMGGLRAVFFVRTIPPPPYPDSFLIDIRQILSSAKTIR